MGQSVLRDISHEGCGRECDVTRGGAECDITLETTPFFNEESTFLAEPLGRHSNTHGCYLFIHY